MNYHIPLQYPGASRLDPATEETLYALYRAYFSEAEETRRWSPWSDVPWDEEYHPDMELTDAVLSAYREDLFLPDYSAQATRALRASRGRAWFATRWSYEKGKSLLALSEWILRSRIHTEDSLRRVSDDLLDAYEWQPPAEDSTTVLADMLLWETHTLLRNRNLRQQGIEQGDTALDTLLGLILTDQDAAQRFFADAVNTIARNHPDIVTNALDLLTTGSDPAARSSYSHEVVSTVRRLLATNGA